MLAYNAHALYRFEYFIAKTTLVPILLNYICNVDAPAKKIPTLICVHMYCDCTDISWSAKALTS